VTKGHKNDAAMALVHSTQVFEELGDRNSWAHATRSLGELRRRQRRFGEAVACLEQSLETFCEHGTAGARAGAPRPLDSYRDQGRLGLASRDVG
jgi:hypothetical protein